MAVNLSYAQVYKKNLVFVNCTGVDIQMNTIAKPYKFSLSPNIEAKNGYSDVYSLTIPSQSVLKYPSMSVYFNSYIDGSIHFYFTGGVNGHASLMQKRDIASVSGSCSCADGSSGSSSHVFSIYKIIGSTDSSADIKFLNGEQIVRIGSDREYTTKDSMVISLGCHSEPKD